MEFVIVLVVFVLALGYLWVKRDKILHELEDASDEFSEAVEEVKEEVEKLEKKIPSKSSLMRMRKDAIEALGREFGIELDRRKSKANMVEDLEKQVKGQE